MKSLMCIILILSSPHAYSGFYGGDIYTPIKLECGLLNKTIVMKTPFTLKAVNRLYKEVYPLIKEPWRKEKCTGYIEDLRRIIINKEFTTMARWNTYASSIMFACC